jgi:hypothetical protein
MGFFDRLYSGRVYSVVSLVFLIIALTLLIVSVSLHNLYTVQFEDIPEYVQSAYNVSLSGTATFGAFTSCNDIDGHVYINGTSTFSVHSCASIPSNCISHYTVVQDGVEIDIEDDPEQSGFSCSQFNAFRAFLVIGIILLGGALGFTLASLTAYWQVRWVMWAAVGLVTGALISVLISYALVADMARKVPLGEYLSKGPAFALAVAAWCLIVVSLTAFEVVKWKGGELKEEAYNKQDDRT